ncbi:hypothetical protein QBC44DRAFT_360330 [Cladorrhinum sp. PSN332]|nr:hypothetical protein QBC44DRAFT_360330 [Cladorrhinum sp. PSN332]
MTRSPTVLTIGVSRVPRELTLESRDRVIHLARLRGVNREIRDFATDIFCFRNRLLLSTTGGDTWSRRGFMQQAQERGDSLFLEVVQKAQKLELFVPWLNRLWTALSSLARAGPIGAKTLTIDISSLMGDMLRGSGWDPNLAAAFALKKWRGFFRKHQFPHLKNLVWRIHYLGECECHPSMPRDYAFMICRAVAFGIFVRGTTPTLPDCRVFIVDGHKEVLLSPVELETQADRYGLPIKPILTLVPVQGHQGEGLKYFDKWAPKKLGYTEKLEDVWLLNGDGEPTGIKHTRYTVRLGKDLNHHQVAGADLMRAQLDNQGPESQKNERRTGLGVLSL